MAAVKLPAVVDWIDVHSLSGVSVGNPLVIKNYWTQTAYVKSSGVKPSPSDEGYPLLSNETIVTEQGQHVWVKGKDGFLWVENQNDSIAKNLVLAEFPEDLYTGGTSRINRRIRVDVGQTGFFSGREFRTFRELNIPTGQTVTIKVVVPLNIILFGLETYLVSGSLRIETKTAGTEGGTFSETLPVLNRNTMSERPLPLYTPQVVLTAGGTQTGGTLLDVLQVQTSGQGNQASSVGASVGDERGVGVGTYYFRMTASGTDPAVGVFRARWEERP